MKKIITTILLVAMLGVMAIGFTSCGNKTVEYGPYTIGIVHSGDTVSQKNATINCIKSLQGSVGSDDLTIYIIADTQKLAEEIKKNSGNEHNDIVKISAHENTLEESVKGWFYNDEGEFANKNDLKVVIATSTKAVNACKGYVKTVPVVGNAVAYGEEMVFEYTNTETGDIAKETIKIPSSLSIVTGNKVADFIKNSTADTNKNIAFICDEANKDSLSHISDIQKELEMAGYTCKTFDYINVGGEEAINLNGYDILYIAHDDKTVQVASDIAKLNKDEIVVITQSEELFDACGDKALVINYDVVGTNAADIAFKLLTGANYSDMGNVTVAVARNKSK